MSPENNGTNISAEFYKKLNQQIVQKDKLIKLLQAQIEKYKSQLESKQETSGQIDNAEVEELKNKLEEAEQEILLLKVELGEKEDEIKNLTEKINELEKAEPKMDIPVDQAEIQEKFNSLNARIKELESEKALLSEELLNAKAEIDAMKAQLTQVENYSPPETPDSDMQAKIEELQDKIFLLEEENAELKEQLKSSSKKSEPSDEDSTVLAAELVAENEELKSKIAELEAQLNELKAGSPETKEEHAELSKLKEENAQLKQQIEELKSMVEAFEGKETEFSKFQENIKKLETELAENKEQLLKLQSERDAILNEKKSLEAELRKVESESSEKTEETQVYIQDVDVLKGLLLQLIDVLENFEIDETTKGKILAILKKHGVEQLNVIGEIYDETKHVLKGTQKLKQAREGEIIEEVKKGYKLFDEIIKKPVVICVKNLIECSNCHNMCRPESTFCDSCGHKLEETAELEPVDTQKLIKIYFDLGKAYENKKEYQKALIQYKEALSVDSNNPEILKALVRVHEKVGNYSEAIKWVTQVESLLPEDPKIKIIKSNLHIKKNLIDQIRSLEVGI